MVGSFTVARPAPARTASNGRCCVGEEDDAPALLRRCSDGKGEFGEARFEPAAGLCIEAEVVVSAAQVLDERMSATDNLVLTFVDLADGAVIRVADEHGVEGPRPLVADGAVVGFLLGSSAW